MAITKIEAAERQLNAAISLFFQDGDPIVVHTLTCAARGIVHGECKRRGVSDFYENVARLDPTVTRSRFIGLATQYANWFKHSDRDEGEPLVGFDDTKNDALLWFVSHDFGRLAKGMSIEMQVMEMWFIASNPEKLGRSEVWPAIDAAFPNLAQMTREEQKKHGLQRLTQARTQPELQMEYSRE